MANNFLHRLSRPGARGKVWRSFALVILLLVAGSFVNFGSYYNRGADALSAKTGGKVSLPHVKEVPYRLGLDLLGGTHLVYQADMSKIESDSDRSNALEGARDVIERRVNRFGVSEPIVQTNRSGDNYQIIVELAGVSDVSEAVKMIGETPLLEFKEQDNQEKQLSTEDADKIKVSQEQAEQRGEEVLGKLLSGGDFAELARQFSEDETTKPAGGDMGWISNATNPTEVALVEKLKNGENSGLVKTSQGYIVLKLEDSRTKKNPFNDKIEDEVKASHLLLCYKGSEGCDSEMPKEEAYEKIKQLKAQANKDNFAQLVRDNSTEPGAKESAGDLGWFGRGDMVEPFENAVFEQEKGTVSYVVETKFGYHIIYKQDQREVKEYKVGKMLFKALSAGELAGIEQQWKNTELTGKNLKRALVNFDPNSNAPQVSLEFDDEGSQMFEAITARNVGQQVAIFLDGYVISAPTVNEKITGGKAVINGSFSVKDANLLAQRLNTGALPVPVTLVNQQLIGPSLGQKSIDDSLRAGFVGFALVAIFMVLYYRLPGLLAVGALCVYSVLALAGFKLMSVTLTLSGLAGFILSIGMAVDANVLIFERIKEELKSGKPLGSSIDEGFKRAWPSIRDSNTASLITCAVLYSFYTGTIRGFAVTLSLGIIISMFSAITVTRIFLKIVESSWVEKHMWLFGVAKKSE
jgi:protein-export membrane protein SecD